MDEYGRIWADGDSVVLIHGVPLARCQAFLSVGMSKSRLATFTEGSRPDDVILWVAEGLTRCCWMVLPGQVTHVAWDSKNSRTGGDLEESVMSLDPCSTEASRKSHPRGVSFRTSHSEFVGVTTDYGPIGISHGRP